MPHKPNALLMQFHDQPALIEEGRGSWLAACLGKVEEASAEIVKIEASKDNEFWFSDDDYRSFYRPYKVKDGILHVPVKGVLMNNFPYALGNWATGYEYIFAAVKRGMEDSDVKGIALIVDSGGGLVSGNFDLNDKLFAFRGRKPMRAYASEHAYSAAYSIASVADSITVARTGGVGSIGVVVVHMEYSKMLENAGITTTIIRSKPGKMEGNSYEVLSKDAQERIQARVDEFDSQFVAIVARNRAMSAEKVHATNAQTFMAQEAIDNGLADEIGSFDDAITAFVATLEEGDEPMAETYSKADLDAAVAAAVAEATATASATAKTEALSAGAVAERTRMSAIMDSEEAKERPAAARMMVNLGVDAEQAKAELAKLPKETAATETTTTTAGAPKGMLQAAMRGTEQPNISADGGEGGDEADPKAAQAAEDAALLRAYGMSKQTETRQ